MAKLGDLDPLTLPSNGWCLCRARGSVYVEYGVVFRWFGLSYTLFIDIISLCLLIGQIKMLACLLTCNKIAGGDNTRRGKNTHTYPVTRPWGFGGVWTPHCPSGPLTRFAQNRWENIGVPPVMSYLRIRLSWAVYEITSRQRICFLFWSPQG